MCCIGMPYPRFIGFYDSSRLKQNGAVWFSGRAQCLQSAERERLRSLPQHIFDINNGNRHSVSP